MPVVYDEPRSIARKQIALLMRVLDGAADFEEQLERWRCVGGCTAMDPENFDDDPEADSRGRDLEETLDGLTARYERIHGMLEEEAQARTSFAAAVATAGSGACSAVIRGRPSTRLVAVLVGTADGARLSTDVAERFCDQTALGFNGAAACAVLEGLAGAARIVATAFEFEGADIDSITVDSIWACLRETATATSDAAAAVGDVGSDLAAASGAIDALDGRVQAVGTRLDLVDQELDQVRAQIAATQATMNHVIELLLMPAGLRPGYQD